MRERQVKGERSTQDLLQSLDRLDVAKIRNAVVRRESGVWVLPQPEAMGIARPSSR